MPELGLLPNSYSIAIPQINYGLVHDVSQQLPPIAPDLRGAARAQMMGSIAQGLSQGLSTYEQQEYIKSQQALAKQKQDLELKKLDYEQDPNSPHNKLYQAQANYWANGGKDPAAEREYRDALRNLPFPDANAAALLAPVSAPSAGSLSPSASTGSSNLPASIRNNNPGAMWPGPVASQAGATGFEQLHDSQGNKIATFDDPVKGAAAQFQLLAKNYAGLPLNKAIARWSGGNSSSDYANSVAKAIGVDPNAPLTVNLLSNPDTAIPLAKAMAKYEAGKPFPLTDDQWRQAHQSVFGGRSSDANNVTIPIDLGNGNMLSIPTDSLTASTNDAGIPANTSVMPTPSYGLGGMVFDPRTQALQPTDLNGGIVTRPAIPVAPLAPSDLTLTSDATAHPPLAAAANSILSAFPPPIPQADNSPQIAPPSGFDPSKPVLPPLGGVGFSPIGGKIYNQLPNGEMYVMGPGGLRQTIKPLAPHFERVENEDGSVSMVGINPQTGEKVTTNTIAQPKGQVFDTMADAEAKLGKGQVAEAHPMANGKLLVTKVKPPEDDAEVTSVANAIMEGTQPPELRGAMKKNIAIRAKLQDNGFNLTHAQQDWEATKNWMKTANGNQQLKMRQALDNAYHQLDVIQDLAEKWKGGGFPILNKGKIIAAKNGLLGSDAQSLAQQMDAQINDLVSELSNVYMGGNSPTTPAMKLAAENLKSDFSEKTMMDSLNQLRNNLQIRSNSIKNSGPIGTTANNPYAPPVNIPSDRSASAIPTPPAGMVEVRKGSQIGHIPADKVEDARKLGWIPAR